MSKIPAFKPIIVELCAKCNSPLYITSAIPENGQVNFICSDHECTAFGFIFKGYKFYDEESVKN